MKVRKLILLLCISALLVPTQARTQSAQAKAAVTVFQHVNVIPMDRNRVLPNQTVVVQGGVIVEMGEAAKVKIPADALKIDGRGKYLVPGLIDMHTHLFSDDDFPDELAGDELMVMLANGVTTIRLMIGTPEQLVLRERVARGELVGPTIYAASPQFTERESPNARVVKTPEEARRAVRECKALGYDFIKLTYPITPPIYDAITEAAKEHGIRVIGHVDLPVGVARALAAGQQIEHLDAYLEAVLKDDSPIKTSVSNVGLFRKENWESLDHIDPRKVSQLARETARAGVYSTPTLTFFKLTFGTGTTEEEIRARPDYRFYTPQMREAWHRALKRLWTDPPAEARRREYVRVRNQLVKEIHEAGGKIMAGSDSPEGFLLYGYSLHRELRSLVEAGLSPYDALAAATRNPAEYLKAQDRFGTIERGKRADLLLLEANPLDSIANTERRAGVMVRGKWFTKAELQSRLDTIADKFQRVGQPLK